MPALARTVGWGLYCTTSWTWCIGMYLPLILLRDYGWPGFIAFAVPNVLGCAAFGYVVDERRGAALRAKFGGAMAAFAAATILYQCAFLTWRVAGDPAGPPAQMLLLVGIALLFVLLRRAGGSDPIWLGIGVAACATSAWVAMSVGASRLPQISWTGARPASELAYAAPIIALGFLACPYLDLTFHRARERSPSRHSFAVFGVTFAAMLMVSAMTFDPAAGDALPLWPVLVQWTVQACATIGMHAREIRRGVIVVAMCLLACGVALWVLPALFADGVREPLAIGGEANYLRILGLYGLVFPFWLILRLRGRPPWLAAMAILACLPFMEAGFVGHRSALLLVPPAVLAVLCAVPMAHSTRTAGAPSAN